MTTAVQELDVRAVPVAERHPLFFRTFDALAEGESMVLVADHEPRPLYYLLRAERPDRFVWVSRGDFRVAITKLRLKETETAIGVYFERDHAEIDVLFAYLRSDVAAHRPSTALFDEFDRRLERHIRWEEEILFPAVESGMPHLVAGPGRVMRMEHEEIRRLKNVAGEILHDESVSPQAYDAAAQALEGTFAVLFDHNRKEEAVYYPMADQIFTAPQAAEILKRVRAQ